MMHIKEFLNFIVVEIIKSFYYRNYNIAKFHYLLIAFYNMKKILSIVGARPQFIKAFVTIKSLNKMKLHNNILLHTGQHFDHDMSEIFFKELKFNQNLIKISLRNQNNRMLRLSEMLYKINNTINKIKPNIIIIYGDTDNFGWLLLQDV